MSFEICAIAGEPQKPVSPTTLTQLDDDVIGGGGVDTGGSGVGVTGDGDTAVEGGVAAGEPPPPPHHAAATANTITRASPNVRGEEEDVI
jgi:hypothetical protein